MTTTTHRHRLVSRLTRGTAAAAVAATIGALLTACGADDATSDTGELMMAIPADEGCMDPAQLLGRSQLTLARAMVDSLVYQDGEAFEPWLATSWEISDEAKAFTFELRDDVTFDDGSELTAQTVVDNLQAVREMGSKSRLGSAYLSTMTDVTAVDAHTVSITFSEPNASFLQAISTPTLGIMSSASAKTDPAKRCLGEIDGSGPYQLDDYRSNEAITLVKRTGYSWAPEQLGEDAATYETVEVSIVPESGIRAGTLVSGETDVITEIKRPDLGTLDRDDIEIESRPNPGIAQQLFVNPKGPVLGDPAVRDALQVGFDRGRLVDATLTEYQKVATSILSSTTPAYIDLGDELVFDQARAMQILDEAGWVPGQDGIRAKNGQRLEASLLYGSDLYGFLVPLMELLQQQYKEIGFDLQLRPLPDGDANTAWIEGDYELRISALTRSDPDALRTGLMGTDDELDKLLQQQARTIDAERRSALVAQAQQLVISKSLGIPINELALPMAHSSAVGNVVYTTDSLVLLSELEPQ